MHDGPQCTRPTSVTGGVSPVYMDYWSAIIISQHDRVTWTMTMSKVQLEQLQKSKLHLNVFMIIVSQWPPDITPQQRVWIQTLTYEQDSVDVSLRMFSEDSKYECWWAAELISHYLSLSAWVHGLANGQRGAGLLVIRINSDSAHLYICLVVCLFVGWFSGSQVCWFSCSPFCVSSFCDRDRVKVGLAIWSHKTERCYIFWWSNQNKTSLPSDYFLKPRD